MKVRESYTLEEIKIVAAKIQMILQESTALEMKLQLIENTAENAKMSKQNKEWPQQRVEVGVKDHQKIELQLLMELDVDQITLPIQTLDCFQRMVRLQKCQWRV